MKRGIYFVANKRSEQECLNAIYSLREAGCTLPISIIPFGGTPLDSSKLLDGVDILPADSFPLAAQDLARRVAELWPKTAPGLYRRLLCWFGPYDEFIYSDNDVVPLMDWTKLFPYLENQDLVHTDHEYKTKLAFNATDPEKLIALLGQEAEERAFTSGHVCSRKFSGFTPGIEAAIAFVQEHPGLLYQHDQSFLIVASVLGGWRVKNLCKPPHNWLSPWAGDYKNTLDIILKIQNGGTIAQLHFAGWPLMKTAACEELLFSSLSQRERLKEITGAGIRQLSGWNWLRRLPARIAKRIKY